MAKLEGLERRKLRIRKKIQGWWTSTAESRIHPGASAIVLHTRWHDDDLIGWLKTKEPDDWEVIELHALAHDDDPDRAPGEPLWPEFWAGAPPTSDGLAESPPSFFADTAVASCGGGASAFRAGSG